MKPLIHDSFPVIAETDLDAAEKRIGVPVPPVYRNFLLKHNGGWPEPSDFTVPFKEEKTESISVEWFLPVNTEESVDLEKTLAVFRDRIPGCFFPIARVGGGSLVCIRTDEGRAGEIWFWDREGESEEGEAPSQVNIYFVAESFDRFLDGLHE